METLNSWKIDSSNPNDGQESIYLALAVLVATLWRLLFRAETYLRSLCVHGCKYYFSFENGYIFSLVKNKVAFLTEKNWSQIILKSLWTPPERLSILD